MSHVVISSASTRQCSFWVITNHHYPYPVPCHHIHHILITYSSHTHHIFITYSSYIYHNSSYSSYIHHIFIIIHHIHHIFIIYSWSIHHIFIIYSSYIHHIFIIYSSYIHHIHHVNVSQSQMSSPFWCLASFIENPTSWFCKSCLWTAPSISRCPSGPISGQLYSDMLI